MKIRKVDKCFTKANLMKYTKGEKCMERKNLRDNKLLLKSILMKNVKTDNLGRVILPKDDEWIEETEWDEIYKGEN